LKVSAANLLDMDTHDYKKPIIEACAAVGGVVKLAKLLGITHSAILQWDKVPPNRALDVERVTASRVTRYDMRPDIYGQRMDVA
jgi:DNA-binding transcriptional regulator YdaS (Cro superfamily)